MKISYSTAVKSLKDHLIIRNNLYKLQTAKGNRSKTPIEMMNQARNSMNETANNLKMIIEEFNFEEKKRVDFFRENLLTVLSQIEYYFLEIYNYLSSQNEKLFQENKFFIEETESLFYKLIYSDAKLNELYKSKYKDTILIEKDKDIEFFRDFDPDSNPLYLKIHGINKKKDMEIQQIERSLVKSEELKESSQKTDISVMRTSLKLTGIKDLKISEFEEKSLDIKKDDPHDNFDQSKSPENLEQINESDAKKLSFSNFDSPMLFKRRKSLESNEGLSPYLFEEQCGSPTIKRNKPFPCDDVIENKSKEEVLSDSEKKTQGINNFDLSNSPRKKRSTYVFFRNKFGLTEGETINSVFSCALSDKMLVQGKMFISNKKIGFHSYFNKRTFLGETKMIIPRNDVIRIEKRYNALIFDNSIAIITPRGELFFTSFVFRDKAYVSIVKIIKPPEQKDLSQILNRENSSGSYLVKNNEESSPYILEEKKEGLNQPIVNEVIDVGLLKKLEERAKNILEIIPKDDFFNDQQFKLKVPGFIQRIEDVFRILFSNEAVRFKGKDYKGYWEYLKVVLSEDIDYKMSLFDPPPPNFYQTSENLEELVNFPNFSERKIEFTHPVRKSGIPFMPKTCPVKEVQKIYWVSHKEFRLICDVRSEKMPYTDCFYISVMYVVRQNEAKKIEITIRFQIVWLKSTILKDTIAKKVTSETVDTTNNLVIPSFLEFLKQIYLSNEYQSKYPIVQNVGEENGNSNKEGNAEGSQQNASEEQNEEIMKKIGDFKKEIESLKEKVKRNELILVVLIGVYFCVGIYHLLNYFLF